MRSKYSTIFLVLANLYPIYGAIFLGWNVKLILYTYWCENLIIGLFTVLKMLKTKIYLDNTQSNNPGLNGNDISRSNSLKIFSFIVRYYFLSYLYYSFINAIILSKDLSHKIIVPVGFIFLSHTFSYVVNFIIGEEYKKLSLEEETKMPIRRLLVVHLTIIFVFPIGAIVFNFKNNTDISLITTMVLVKIILDISAHLKEHKGLQNSGTETI